MKGLPRQLFCQPVCPSLNMTCCHGIKGSTTRQYMDLLTRARKDPMPFGKKLDTMWLDEIRPLATGRQTIPNIWCTAGLDQTNFPVGSAGLAAMFGNQPEVNFGALSGGEPNSSLQQNNQQPYHGQPYPDYPRRSAAKPRKVRCFIGSYDKSTIISISEAVPVA